MRITHLSICEKVWRPLGLVHVGFTGEQTQLFAVEWTIEIVHSTGQGALIPAKSWLS